ncbi:MAG: tRNA (N6-threonylcarbamoyladenosine(37)-N6)-methyltransferase TrmO [Candidatus Acetothermia bacterium]
MEEEFCFNPVGRVLSPHESPEGTPIQPSAAEGVEGKVEVFPDYREGLEDLEGFSHVILVYVFHMSAGSDLKVKPFMDERDRGVFATRSPARPNPLGISTVRLTGVESGHLHIKDVDLLDGTPVLDLKPYVAEFDRPDENENGWLAENVHKLDESRDDGRFAR